MCVFSIERPSRSFLVAGCFSRRILRRVPSHFRSFFYFVAVVIFDVLSLATFYILRHSIGGLRRDRRLLSMCRSRNVHRKILGEKYANEPLGFVRRSSR